MFLNNKTLIRNSKSFQQKWETIPMDCSKNLSILFNEKNLIVSGDVKIELKSLFHFWFNTFFVNRNAGKISFFSSIFYIYIFLNTFDLFLEREGEGDNMRYKYVLKKHELDGAHKDKSNHFAKDFKVRCLFSLSFLHIFGSMSFRLLFDFFITFDCENIYFWIIFDMEGFLLEVGILFLFDSA